jgi:hypothetical protein
MMQSKQLLLRCCSAGLVGAALMAASAGAQQSAEEAVALVEAYIQTHNAHQPEETLAFYHDDADFHLSMQRGAVQGIEAIARLEYFDAAVGSTLYPQHLVAHPYGNAWRVGFAYVIEYSEIFAAMGLTIVLAEGMETGFVLDQGRIRTIFQPELNPACMGVMGPGFAALIRWLKDSDDPRRSTLAPEGSLQLTADTGAVLIDAARDWRKQTGWGPTREQALECARVRPLAAPARD